MATSTFTSKADIAYAEIRRQILEGTLEAGSRLPQYDIAAALGISITPLREAVRRLSGEGWVLVDTHRKARVAPLDLAQGRELLEARRAVEPAAVALAAARRTPADVERMTTALDHLLPVTREWGEEALVAHREVHEALYRASHNAVMIGVLDDLWDRSDRYRRIGLQLPDGAEPRERDRDEHHRLVDLVVAGDAAGAAALAEHHIDHSLTAAAIAQRDAEGGTGSGD